MKICYLILAHNNWRHLDRLIDALRDENSSFYIHIDKKVSDYFVSSGKRIHVISERYNIRWGGFSMVEATLSLLKNGINHSPDYDYYVLISGVDYPIRSKEFLHDLLTKKKEYIDISPVPVLYKPIERYQYYYYDYDRRNLNYFHPKFLTEVILKKIGIKRTSPFKVYAGTQWFALTCDCVKYILDVVANDKRYMAFFRHTLIPDEAFFQTIIGNSPFYQQVASSLTYTDWEVPIPPATIQDRHIDYLRDHIEFNDEYGQRFPFFARKFNNDSESLIKRIQKELW